MQIEFTLDSSRTYCASDNNNDTYDYHPLEFNKFYELEDGSVVYSTRGRNVQVSDTVWGLPDSGPGSKHSMWGHNWDVHEVEYKRMFLVLVKDGFDPTIYGGVPATTSVPGRMCDCGVTVPGALAAFKHLCK